MINQFKPSYNTEPTKILQNFTAPFNVTSASKKVRDDWERLKRSSWSVDYELQREISFEIWNKTDSAKDLLSISPIPLSRSFLFIASLLRRAIDPTFNKHYVRGFQKACLLRSGFFPEPFAQERRSAFWETFNRATDVIFDKITRVLSFNQRREVTPYGKNRMNLIEQCCYFISRFKDWHVDSVCKTLASMIDLTVDAICQHEHKSLEFCDEQVVSIYRCQHGPLEQAEYDRLQRKMKKFYEFDDAKGMKLAQGIVLEGCFGDCPILADLVEECEGPQEVLDHLRDESTFHNYGCWAVEMCRGVNSRHVYQPRRRLTFDNMIDEPTYGEDRCEVLNYSHHCQNDDTKRAIEEETHRDTTALFSIVDPGHEPHFDSKLPGLR